MTPGETIEVENLPAGLGMALGKPQPPAPSGALVIPYEGASLQDFKDRAEKEFILASLSANDWQMAATAKAISTPRSNLYKKLETHDIKRDKGDVE